MERARKFFKFIFLVTGVCYGTYLACASIGRRPLSIIYNDNINETLIDHLLNEDEQNATAFNVSSTSFRKLRPQGVSRYIEISVDNKSTWKYMWPDDPLCSQHTVRFGKDIFGAWLLTFPRSGNTWTRYLLEGATGIFTGSVYHAAYAKRAGFLGENVSGRKNKTIVIKTHKTEPLKESKRPVVIIIRNPARSVVSYWNYKQIKDEGRRWKDSANEKSYNTPAFHNHVRLMLRKWLETYKYALKNSKQLHVVFYEKLREQPLRELRDILRFLRVRPDHDRFLCLQRHLEGVAMGAQRDHDPYSLEEKKKFKSAVNEINALLISRGFQSLPDYNKYET